MSGSTIALNGSEEVTQLRIGAVTGITAGLTLLVSLPVGVVLGCGGRWWWVWSANDGRRCPGTSCCRRKKPRVQGAIYEDPDLVGTAIALSPNDAYAISRQEV